MTIETQEVLVETPLQKICKQLIQKITTMFSITATFRQIDENTVELELAERSSWPFSSIKIEETEEIRDAVCQPPEDYNGSKFLKITFYRNPDDHTDATKPAGQVVKWVLSNTETGHYIFENSTNILREALSEI